MPLSLPSHESIEREELGILKPLFLSKMRIHVVYEKLRVSLSLAKRTDLRFSDLASILDKKVQRARYDEFLIQSSRCSQWLFFLVLPSSPCFANSFIHINDVPFLAQL